MKNKILSFVKKNNWLLNYSKFEGISRSFIGLSTRTKFVSNLEKAPDLLKKNESSLEEVFVSFFPDLKKMVEEKGQDYFNKVK